MADRPLMVVDVRGKLSTDLTEMVASGRMRRQVEAAHKLADLLARKQRKPTHPAPERGP